MAIWLEQSTVVRRCYMTVFGQVPATSEYLFWIFRKSQVGGGVHQKKKMDNIRNKSQQQFQLPLAVEYFFLTCVQFLLVNYIVPLHCPSRSSDKSYTFISLVGYLTIVLFYYNLAHKQVRYILIRCKKYQILYLISLIVTVNRTFPSNIISSDSIYRRWTKRYFFKIIYEVPYRWYSIQRRNHRFFSPHPPFPMFSRRFRLGLRCLSVLTRAIFFNWVVIRLTNCCYIL